MLQYNEGEYATMWVDTSLIITPTENSKENPTTPSEPEKPSDKPVTPTTPTQEKEPQTTENKTEQTNNKTNTETNEETNNPKTGDNIITSVTLFITSITTIGMLTVINRKKAKK